MGAKLGQIIIRNHDKFDPDYNHQQELQLVPGNLDIMSYRHQFYYMNLASLSSNMFVMKIDMDTDTPGLLLYNPVELTYHLRAQLEDLGLPIKFLVLPNKEHKKFYREYIGLIEKYPGMKLLCSPGTKARFVEKPEWETHIHEIDTVKLPTEIGFHGLKHLDETLLFYRPTETLITCDMAMNFTDKTITLANETQMPIVIAYAKKSGVPKSFKHFISDTAKASVSVDEICNLGFKVICMAHGEPAEGDDVAKTWRKSWKSLIREKEVGSGKDKVVEEEREDDEEGKEETKKETNSGFQKTTSGEAVTEAEQRRNLRNWRQESEKRLTDFEQHVIWEKGTEMAGSGKYDKFYPPQGYFACKVCEQPLYSAESKFDSGCGWPAFDRFVEGSVKMTEDRSEGMVRTEITCNRCDAHLGHVFYGEHLTDTNERHCVNSASIVYKDEQSQKE